MTVSGKSTEIGSCCRQQAVGRAVKVPRAVLSCSSPEVSDQPEGAAEGDDEALRTSWVETSLLSIRKTGRRNLGLSLPRRPDT
jgi:hypothetical protein